MKLILFGLFCILSLVEADIIDTQPIKGTGEIKCCKTIGFFGIKLCEAPKKARVELWNHLKVSSDTLLLSMENKNMDKYTFKWSDDKVFDVKPILKIYVECQDGTTFDGTYDYTETKPTKISHFLEVTMK